MNQKNHISLYLLFLEKFLFQGHFLITLTLTYVVKVMTLSDLQKILVVARYLLLTKMFYGSNKISVI